MTMTDAALSAEAVTSQRPSIAPPTRTPAANADEEEDDDDLFGDGDDGVAEEKKSPDAQAENISSTTNSSGSPSLRTTGSTNATVVSTNEKSPVSQDKSTPAMPSYAPIPHKTEASPTSKSQSLLSSIAPPSIDPSAFGLPAGVKIPKSVTAPLLQQGKLLDTIKTLPCNLINDALLEYDDAVEIKGSAIRNHGAYLYGVVKRYVSVHERANSGEGSGILPMGENLTPAIHNRLEQLVTSGFCTRDEMNEKVRSKIRMLSEKDALFALDELSSVERRSIRNFGSYFMGILNRYMRGDMSSKIRPNSNNSQDRSRGRDRSYRDNHHPSSFHRDRSRDRYGDASSRGKFNDSSKSLGMDPYRRDQSMRPPNMYDTRQHQLNWQPPPQQQQQQLPPPPPPVPYNMGGQQQQQPQAANLSMNSMSQPQQFIQPNQPQGMYQPPGTQAPMQQQPMIQQQQQGYPNTVNQQGMQQQPGVPMQQQPGAPMQQQQQPLQMVGNMQQQPYYGNQQPFVQQQQQPQQPVMNQQGYGNVPQVQQGGTMMGSVPPPPGGWQGQQQQQQQPPPQQQPQVPVDILGLADKAASAVQALANQSKTQQMPPPAPPPYSPMTAVPQTYNAMGNQQQMPYAPQLQAPMGQQQMPYASNSGMAPPPQQFHDSGHARRSGRRTTANFNDLPVSVQYAVQNMQASGAVQGPLDDGILGMINDLPERMALDAIQRFNTIDKSTMRNTTAYFAGMLRRELENIKKR